MLPTSNNLTHQQQQELEESKQKKNYEQLITIAKPCSAYIKDSCEGHYFCIGEIDCPRLKNNAPVYGGAGPHSLGIYTNDSAICGAALHAGIIDKHGGTFQLEPLPGQSEYSGSTNNSITTRSWKSYPKSFSISPSCAFPPTTDKELLDAVLISQDDGKTIIPENVSLLTTHRAQEILNDSRPEFTGNVTEFTKTCKDYKKDSCQGRFYCPGAPICQKMNSYRSSTCWGIGPNGEQTFTGDSCTCLAAQYFNVIADKGWYELRPAQGFQSFIGGTTTTSSGATITIRPWSRPYLNCFQVFPVKREVDDADDDLKMKQSLKRQKHQREIEPALVRNHEEKMSFVKGEEYF